MITKEQLEKINSFTRREFKEEEIYAFSVILCDNETDRDGEQFSEKALSRLAELFVGKTGIFDHAPKSSNQNMRIYDTEFVSDSVRKTRDGRQYKYLKAFAYMIRTPENSSLIAEIEGGIKKEVSISCAAAKKICSVCGCDRTKSACIHAKGRKYGGKECFVILDDITDAYEWSFVAVPAQVNAGVTRKTCQQSAENYTEKAPAMLSEAEKELRRDICRIAFFSGGKALASAVSKSAEFMDAGQLIGLKKSLEAEAAASGNFSRLQLAEAEGNPADMSAMDGFSMK